MKYQISSRMGGGEFMGPIAIYDKSVLEALNKEEAILLHRYFYINMTPIILLEVVADLKEKSRHQGQTAEQRVARLAEKLPVTNCMVNVHHVYLAKDELFEGGIQGRQVPMDRLIISASPAEHVTNSKAEGGLIYSESNEEKALRSWRNSNFTELDHLLAQRWKGTQKSLNLDSFATELKGGMSNIPIFHNIQEIKHYVDKKLSELNETQPQTFLQILLQHFGASENSKRIIFEKWEVLNRECRRTIKPIELAPYVYYLFSVELFFKIALSQRLVESGKRSKSHIDLQYLYYLPFCMTFISNDKFHKKVVPLFLKKDQTFIDGKKLKIDLMEITEHLKNLPEREKKERDTGYPPQIQESVICKDFDFHIKGWRKKELKKIRLSQEQNDKLIEELNSKMTGVKDDSHPGGVYNNTQPDFIKIERTMTRQQLKDNFDLSDDEI